MLYTLETRQLLKTDIDTAWAFMSSPKNLATITPEYMNFEILTDIKDQNMYPGQLIEYYVRPLLGIKIHWTTEITHVVHHAYFVDEQRKGPYSLWHHKHFLKETTEGVEMYDLVHYELPFGIIGRLAHILFIKNQLKAVFDYRYKALEQLFNQK